MDYAKYRAERARREGAPVPVTGEASVPAERKPAEPRRRTTNGYGTKQAGQKQAAAEPKQTAESAPPVVSEYADDAERAEDVREDSGDAAVGAEAADAADEPRAGFDAPAVTPAAQLEPEPLPRSRPRFMGTITRRTKQLFQGQYEDMNKLAANALPGDVLTRLLCTESSQVRRLASFFLLERTRQRSELVYMDLNRMFVYYGVEGKSEQAAVHRSFTDMLGSKQLFHRVGEIDYADLKEEGYDALAEEYKYSKSAFVYMLNREIVAALPFGARLPLRWYEQMRGVDENTVEFLEGYEASLRRTEQFRRYSSDGTDAVMREDEDPQAAIARTREMAARAGGAAQGTGTLDEEEHLVRLVSGLSVDEITPVFAERRRKERKRKYVCGACRAEIRETDKICPYCRAVLDPTYRPPRTGLFGGALGGSLLAVLGLDALVGGMGGGAATVHDAHTMHGDAEIGSLAIRDGEAHRGEVDIETGPEANPDGGQDGGDDVAMGDEEEEHG